MNTIDDVIGFLAHQTTGAAAKIARQHAEREQSRAASGHRVEESPLMKA